MKNNNDVFRSLSMISQFSIHILVPVCMCSYIGYLLDQKLGTSFLFIILFFVGALAGGRNVYLLAWKISNGKEKSPSKLYASNQRIKRNEKNERKNKQNK